MKKRILILSVSFAIVFAGFVGVLIFNSTAKADEYKQVEKVSEYSVSATAPRGEILDCNGNALVYNEQINTLCFNALNFPKENAEINECIFSLIRFLTQKNETWFDTLPIELDNNGNLVFKEKSENMIKWLKSSDMCAVNDYATAENCFKILTEKFELENYSKEDALKIASVRCNMQKMYFSASVPYTFAENISVTTIAYIKENRDTFPGVDADMTSTRKYVGTGTTATHILGIIGSLTAEEYNQKTEETKTALANSDLTEDEYRLIANKSYALNDTIGKSGIESAMEDYLRGTKGTKLLSVNSENEISQSYSYLPSAGNTVFLTLDRNLQEISDKSLEKQILAVTSQEALKRGLTPAGAVVVQDVKTGAVLASSSYPTYSLATYYDDYSVLAEDPGKPLWNRAFQSTYSPGSTMKPVIAIAALEEGLIDADSRVYCTGQYEYIDQVFACFNKTAHGNINVAQALQHSCNIFFFEMARLLGIEKMNMYSSLFGLGQKTGIEIAESKGILAGITYRDSIGQGWKAGETLLAAIGQSDNSFSPLQLNNYCSTIANGGTRYVPYLVDKIVTSDYSKTVFEHTPEVAAETNISKSTMDTVKYGMYLVANEGSCQPYLGNLTHKVACKTGTAEKTLVVDGNIVEGTDGFIIAFGPYEDPQIAVTVVIENAGSGSSTAQVAADIFEYYFSTLDSTENVQKENTVLW